jgi:hypothetical protein
MKAAQRDVLKLMSTAQGEDDPGPWFMVSRGVDGTIRTLSRPKPVEEADQATAEERPLGTATRPECWEAITTGEAA